MMAPRPGLAPAAAGPREALLRAWYGGAGWLWLLRPLEAVFRLLAAARRGLYRHGVLATWRAPVPVVVVGNIALGGTGKTPVVIALVEELQERGIRVGVVSRGYGATGLTAPLRVTAHSSADECGDEPLLIHRRTGCPCVVAPSRVAAARLLLATTAVDIIISDDGLQHYALGRDREIVLLDADRGTGNGFCLPAGPLREPVSRLRTVDHVLYRGGAGPASAVHYEATGLVHVATGEQRPATPAAIGRAVHAVAGIGQPGQFFDSLRALGFAPQLHAFADHHRYGPGDFAGLAGKPIIMTEKDAVKCAGLAGDNAWYLRIEARLPAAVSNAVAALARS